MFDTEKVEIKNGLEFERFFAECCKDSLKKGLFNEFYVPYKNEGYIRLTATIVGHREMDIPNATENLNTRVRYFLIYVNHKVVKNKIAKPTLYKNKVERLNDSNSDKVIKGYLDYYLRDKGEFKGIVITKKDAFKIVETLYLQILNNIEFEENKKLAAIMMPTTPNIVVDHLDSLDAIGVEEDGQLKFC